MNEKPKLIYKYTGFEAAESILSNCALKFTNPKIFNDPFDCDVSGLYFNLNGTIDPKVQKEILQLKKDFFPAVLDNKLLAKMYEEVIVEKLSKTVITCFSTEQKNHLLWSHYAQNHTGICLGFNNEIALRDKFIDLTLGMEGTVSYGYDEKVNFVEDKLRGYYKLYLTKLKPWEYEKEYRLIALQDEGLYHFKKEFLCEVIFGLRVPKEHIDRIIRVCKRCNLENLRFLKAEIKYSEIAYLNI